MIETARVILSKIPVIRNSEYALKTYTKLRSPVELSTGQAKASFEIESLYDFSDISNFKDKEKSRINEIVEFLDEDDVFYDIGAYKGLWTCLIGDILPCHQVIAFEPNPQNYNKLKDNLIFNNINPITYNTALSNSDGSVKFKLDESQSSVSVDSNQNNNVRQVNTRKCDNLISDEDLPTPSVVKIDVEGFELKVIKGMSDIISDIEFFIIELHYPKMEEYNSNPESIVEILEENGFIIELRTSDGEVAQESKPKWTEISHLIAKKD